MGSGTTGRPRASPYGEHLQPIWAPVVRLTLTSGSPLHMTSEWASKSTPSSRSIVGPITGAPWTLALQPWKSHSRAASSPTTCARSWRTRWLRQSRRCDRCWSKSVKSGALLGSQARCLEAAGGVALVAAEGVAAEEGAGVGGEEEGAVPEGGAAAATLLAGGRAGHACTCSGEWRAGRVGLGQLFDACQDGEHWHVLQVA